LPLPPLTGILQFTGSTGKKRSKSCFPEKCLSFHHTGIACLPVSCGILDSTIPLYKRRMRAGTWIHELIDPLQKNLFFLFQRLEKTSLITAAISKTLRMATPGTPQFFFDMKNATPL
jgi:hypothetical protein